MEKEKNLQEIVDQMKGLENGINGMIVPMLKDTINDCGALYIYSYDAENLGAPLDAKFDIEPEAVIKKADERMYNNKEFLSQFEFEGVEENYSQDLDATDGGDAVINSGINVNK